MREFLWSEDMADACVHVMEQVDFKDTYELSSKEIRNTHINIGTGKEISIRELADLIANIVGFRGKLMYDSSKPDGSPQKLLDVSRLREFGWQPKISFQEGISKTYTDYLKNVFCAA